MFLAGFRLSSADLYKLVLCFVLSAMQLYALMQWPRCDCSKGHSFMFLFKDTVLITADDVCTLHQYMPFSQAQVYWSVPMFLVYSDVLSTARQWWSTTRKYYNRVDLLYILTLVTGFILQWNVYRFNFRLCTSVFWLFMLYYYALFAVQYLDTVISASAGHLARKNVTPGVCRGSHDDRCRPVNQKARARERYYIYTLWVKKGTSILLPIALADVDVFSKFFHCWIHQEICNKLTVTFPTTP